MVSCTFFINELHLLGEAKGLLGKAKGSLKKCTLPNKVPFVWVDSLGQKERLNEVKVNKELSQLDKVDSIGPNSWLTSKESTSIQNLIHPGIQRPTPPKQDSSTIDQARLGTGRNLPISIDFEGAGHAGCVVPTMVHPISVSYELKSGLIQLLPKFDGLASEDPHKHLKEFHVACSTMRLQGMLEDYIKMKAFLFSLNGATKDWLYVQLIMFNTCGDMKRMFLEKFFLASKTMTI
ncbi:hypothetical protein CR513_31165, partial [Mucuna pruriens]